MDAINTKTELYDLFGESVFCAVCQEDIKEGERVRTIRSCQHAFHMNCVDPWLKNKGNCPNCRAPLEPPSANEIIHNIYRVSHRLRTIIQNNPGFNIDDFLSQIETVASNAIVETPEIVLERYILGYCLAQGILKKFPAAGPYRENATAIRTILANFQHEMVRPYPLDCSCRTALLRSKNLMRDEIIRRLSWEGSVRMFHTVPSVARIIQQLGLVGGGLAEIYA
jgi:hypothetical protein